MGKEQLERIAEYVWIETAKFPQQKIRARQNILCSAVTLVINTAYTADAELFSLLEYTEVSFARKLGVEERETCTSVQQF